LNPKWNKDWGGELELFDRTGDKLIKKIAPIFNRLVVFDTNDYSFHGISSPLNFPLGESRKSIILYYYTKASRPLDQSIGEGHHSALWVKRNLKDKKGSYLRKKYE
jgi:Rps23 Pro-64 3,4-dihydroxylase Tpa1-like proline 4-hydroxylase